MTTNINISRNQVFGNCDLKCAYNFKYPETILTATNDQSIISLTCENTNTPPVTYNTQKYNVSKIMIVTPSIHIFDNFTTKAEIIIIHTPVYGGNNLQVCVPIIESATTSKTLTEIIQNVSNYSPINEPTTLNINGFTLNSIVPNKPFYTYTNDNTDYIVFDISYAIELNKTTLNKLKQMLPKPFPLPTPGGRLFYNKNGPNQTKISEGIYISCQPTGSSTEETNVEYSKNQGTYEFISDSTKKIIIQLIMGCIVLLFIYGLINYGYPFLAGTGKINIPNFSNPFKSATMDSSA